MAKPEHADRDLTRDRYEAAVSRPLTVLAFGFLVVYAVPILKPELNPILMRAISFANIVIWIVFAADLLVRIVLERYRFRFILRHPIDILLVALPMLRPLRVLRIFTAGQTLFARRRGLLKSTQAIVFAAALLVFIGALAELDAERPARGANITKFSDAIWWALTTVTTVGYGDQYPITTTGRLVAGALMLVGISLLGLITATVASWFVAQEKAGEQAASDRLDVIEAKLDRILGQLQRYELANLSDTNLQANSVDPDSV